MKPSSLLVFILLSLFIVTCLGGLSGQGLDYEGLRQRLEIEKRNLQSAKAVRHEKPFEKTADPKRTTTNPVDISNDEEPNTNSNSNSERTWTQGSSECKSPLPDALVIGFEYYYASGSVADCTPLTNLLTSMGITYDYVISREDDNNTFGIWAWPSPPAPHRYGLVFLFFNGGSFSTAGFADLNKAASLGSVVFIIGSSGGTGYVSTSSSIFNFTSTAWTRVNTINLVSSSIPFTRTRYSFVDYVSTATILPDNANFEVLYRFNNTVGLNNTAAIVRKQVGAGQIFLFNFICSFITADVSLFQDLIQKAFIPYYNCKPRTQTLVYLSEYTWSNPGFSMGFSTGLPLFRALDALNVSYDISYSRTEDWGATISIVSGVERTATAFNALNYLNVFIMFNGASSNVMTIFDYVISKGAFGVAYGCSSSNALTAWLSNNFASSSVQGWVRGRYNYTVALTHSYTSGVPATFLPRNNTELCYTASDTGVEVYLNRKNYTATAVQGLFAKNFSNAGFVFFPVGPFYDSDITSTQNIFNTIFQNLARVAFNRVASYVSTTAAQTTGVQTTGAQATGGPQQQTTNLQITDQASIVTGQTEPVKSKSGSSVVPIIIGAVVGVLCLLAIIIVAVVVLMRMKRKAHSEPHSPQPLAPQNGDGSFNSNYAPLAHYGSVSQQSGSMVVPPQSVAPKSKRENFEIDYTELEMQELVGQGAFGAVYKAFWRETVVAVKQVLIVNERELDSFKKECELLKNIRPHPNLVLFLGITTPPQPLTIVLEFCEMGSLASYLRDPKNVISDELKFQFLGGIARGVNHLHRENIIHRDLAARNILLTKNLEPKVSDFGMSRVQEGQDEGSTRSEVGPLKWMSPEAIQQKVYSRKSDVWSFGVVTWEVVTRQEPYKGMDVVNVGMKVVYEGLTLEIPSDAPELFQNIMGRCWLRDPKSRPDMSELCDILKSKETQSVQMGGYTNSSSLGSNSRGNNSSARLIPTPYPVSSNNSSSSLGQGRQPPVPPGQQSGGSSDYVSSRSNNIPGRPSSPTGSNSSLPPRPSSPTGSNSSLPPRPGSINPSLPPRPGSINTSIPPRPSSPTGSRYGSSSALPDGNYQQLEKFGNN